MPDVRVANAAREVLDRFADGEGASEDLWRFGVLQLLDDYESARKAGGVVAAESVFAEEPVRPGADADR